MATIFSYMAYMKNTKFLIDQGILFYFIYGFMTVFAYLCSVLLMENFFHKQVLQSELEQTERLHLLTDMAASFAHEIRNPLTVATGFMQLLQQSTADDKRKQHIQLVTSELQRAEGIISDYLTYARPSVNDVKVLPITEALERVVGVMSPFAAMNNVQILISAETSLSIQVNEQKFTQIIMNIVKNAIEAIPNGGTVNIRADQSDDHVLVEIRDDGIGMTKLQLLQLGKPYYSTKTNGTGVGLMVTFQLVKLMGGKLRYSSKPGNGTTAILQFPMFTDERQR
jgi:two-component system, sporulation sensor kinase B